MRNGGQLLVECLVALGAKTSFGVPGESYLAVLDALHDTAGKLDFVLCRNEGGASFMAAAWGKLTGTPGICLVTRGPGATNASIGVHTAMQDSVPMLLFVGQAETGMLGREAFQELDYRAVFGSMAKWAVEIDSPDRIPEIVARAWKTALTGRPGPVLIDIPKDHTAPNKTFPYEYPKKVKMRSYMPVSRGHSGQIRKAVDELLKAKRPVIYSGGGVVQGDASEALTAVARKLNYPVTNTLMGLGAYPGTDEQFLGMLGMHGTYEANMSMHNADVILAAGARLDDRVTNDAKKFCPGAKIIHIDIDPASISKNVTAHIPIVGPVKQVLEEMLTMIDEHDSGPDHKSVERWWQEIDGWRQVHGLRYEVNENGPMKPQQVVQALYKATNGEAFVTSDVGQHQMFAAQYYLYDRPRQWINSGGLGTMGFGLPAAMGVQFAYPDGVVACVTGEGSIQMNIQELSTCLQYGLPIKIININNQALGMVRQWQDMQYGGRHSQSYMESLPDFVKLAESYGHVGMLVEKFEDLQPAMDEAFALKDRLVFMDIYVDSTEHVYPMHIADGAMRDMWLSKTERT